MEMNEIINKVRQELISKSDDKTRDSAQHFFKETVLVHGIKAEAVRKIGKENFKLLKGGTKGEVFELCEELWKSGFVEESIIACLWSYELHKKYEPEDIMIFKKWISEYVDNWASCDTLCNHSVGILVEKNPELIHELISWTQSGNRWNRRAAAVSLIIPGRKGMFLNEIFQIADLLLTDHEDLVQKGYGWLLKEASRIHCEEVFGFIMNRKVVMPRTALRYSIEKMPVELRKLAMQK